MLGQIANTNAQRISRVLASIGVDVYFHTVVGDNLQRATRTIASAMARSDVVIITGGLGPTPDDLTREAVALALDRPLYRDGNLEQEVRAIFGRMRRTMPDTNLRQAELPRGAVPIPPEGTAPGFYIEDGGRVLFALPGVPWEMEAMLAKLVLPFLGGRPGGGATVSREVLVVGLGESRTHEKIADLVDAQSNPTIAYLAGGGQVRVRITAKAGTESQALDLIGPVEAEIRERLGSDAIEADCSLAGALGRLLRARGAAVAVAESLTGGAIGAALTAEPGASDFFLGSLVCYSTEAKRALAGVDEAMLAAYGAVSEEVATALATAAAGRFGAGLGISATGVAGPTEQDGKPVGTIFVAASLGARTEVRHVYARGDRANVRSVAVTSALDLGRRVLLDER